MFFILVIKGNAVLPKERLSYFLLLQDMKSNADILKTTHF